MKILKSVVTTIVALIGVIIGTIWAVETNWSWEPILLMVSSLAQLIAFIILKSFDVNAHEGVKAIEQSQLKIQAGDKQSNPRRIDRDSILDLMKSKTKILFVDDDKNFNVVKILKDSGWKNTKTIADLANLDSQNVKDADILFVDINGVGRLINLENQGLDLALMLKQRYPGKKVVIYSANKNSNSFHAIWDVCDYKLEKNALPYQFQNLVEEFSMAIYNETK